MTPLACFLRSHRPSALSLSLLLSLSGAHLDASEARAEVSSEVSSEFGASLPRQSPSKEEALRARNARAPLASLATRPFSKHEARGYGGMVTADNALASEAGAQVLREGGDAIDAAVTTALMLGVLQPFASGIGGGGFAVVWRAQEGASASKKHYALDFREVAPAAAHAKMYLDERGDVKKHASTRGALAAGVPGELAGLFELHKRHGKLPWARLVEPALKAARDGFEMHPLLYDHVGSAKGWLKRSPTLSASFLTPSGEPKPLGALITRPKLAHTLELIAQRGAEGFYEGEVAQEMVRAIKAGGGVMSLGDLKTYQPKERAALKGEYGPYELLTMPPPSSGGAVILQVLAVLEQLEQQGAWGLTPADHDPEQLHVLTEALKHAFADRANLMGDPDFVPVPVEQMLSSARVQQIKALFNPNNTLEHEQYGGHYAATPDGGTSHFNVIDKHGNAVALTTTVNTSFGSRFVAGESGVLLNNEMDDFVAKPGVPNAFGLVGREANAIAPLKRPLSSMSPTIIVERGEVRGMVGASGGPTIITGTLEVALNLIHKHAQTGDVATSVSAPRVHHQWSPDLLFCDDGVPEATQEALKSKGHAISGWRGGRFTSVQALWRYDAHDERGALLVGASDPTKLGRPSAVE